MLHRRHLNAGHAGHPGYFRRIGRQPFIGLGGGHDRALDDPRQLAHLAAIGWRDMQVCGAPNLGLDQRVMDTLGAILS